LKKNKNKSIFGLAFLDWGLSQENTPLDNRHIQLTNYFTVLAIINILLYNIPTIILALPHVLFFNFYILIYLISIVFNKLNKTFWAKLIFCFNTTLSISIIIFIFVGREPGFQYYYLLFAIAPILIWSSRHIVLMVFFVLLNIALFLIVEQAGGNYLNLSKIPQSALKFYQITTLLTSFLTIVGIIVLFQKQAIQINKKLEQQKNNLTDVTYKLNAQKNEMRLKNEKINYQRQELERLNEELTQKNGEITRQRDQLLELIATKDKFFSLLAHDLKNPFQVLLTVSEMLSKSFKDQSTQENEFIQMIYHATRKSYSLLENLLEWSRCQTGSMNFNPEPINLSEPILQAVSLCQELANNKKIYLSYDIPSSLKINADKYMLRSVLHNLLTNAIKFSPRESVVHLKIAEWQDGYIVSVKDRGVGISADKIKDLFKVGVHQNSLGTENETGTGLGLIICREFIEKHGGKIWVESEINQGTEFKFTLPKGQMK